MAMPSTPKRLFFAAAFVVLGMLCAILSCTAVANHNAWPLLALMFYFFTPIPFFICSRGGGGSSLSYSDGGDTCLSNLGDLIGGASLVSGPCIAVVEYHTGVISLSALLLILLAGVMILAAVVVLSAPEWIALADDDDDY